jgi:hypothetical protein
MQVTLCGQPRKVSKIAFLNSFRRRFAFAQKGDWLSGRGMLR